MNSVDVSAQDTGILSTAILYLPTDQLASILALIEQVRLHRLLEKRFKDLVSKTDQSFEKALQEESSKLAQLTRAELSIRLLGNLNRGLGLAPRNYASERDILDNAEDIIEAAIRLKVSIDKNFDGTSLSELVQYQMVSLLRGLGAEVENLGDEDQQRIVDSVREFIHQLPSEQQQQIKDALGTDQLTDKVVLQAIISGGLATSFATAVHMAGFSFYTGATSLLASITGVLGITLPFATYTTLTSLIAVISSPLFLIPLLAGGGAFIYQKGERKLRDGLLPIIVAQLAVAGSELSMEEQYKAYMEEVIETWYAASEDCKSLREEVIDLAHRLQILENEREAAKAELDLITVRIDEKNKEGQLLMLNVGHAIQAELDAVAAGKWGPGMALLAENLVDQTDELARSSTEKDEGGIIKKYVNRAIQQASRRVKERRLSKLGLEAAGRAYTLWQGGEEILNDDIRHEFESMENLSDEMGVLMQDEKDVRAQLKKQSDSVRALSNDKKKCEANLQDAESKFYGLSQQL